MNNNLILKTTAIIACTLLYACQSSPKKSISIDTIRSIHKKNAIQPKDKETEFERSVYLSVSAIHTGVFFGGKNGKEVFYRVLEIPEEENTMLIAEKISVGEEGGNYQLVKRIQLTDLMLDSSKYSFNNIDSLKFVDSVRIREYLDGRTKLINLDSIK